MGLDCWKTLIIVVVYGFASEVCTKSPQRKTVKCPANQMYRSNITICGSTCSTYDFRQQCLKDTPTSNGCGCMPGTVLLPNGTCVQPNLCPCAFDGQLYYPREKLSVGCVDYVCFNRQWTVLSERNCKRRCRAFGDVHYITFDDFKYSFRGTCEHTLVKHEKLFQVTASNLPSGSTGVTKAIKVKVGGTEVHLIGLMNATINGVPVMRAPQVRFDEGVLVHTDLFTILSFDIQVQIYWDEGTGITIALSTTYSGQVGGLCGNFDGILSNDLVDLTSGLQPSGTIAEFTSRWKTVENCPDTDVALNFDPCLNNTKRKDRALKSCAIIREGELFAACRKLVDSAEDFYQRCLIDSCGCDDGGERKCAIVAAFARECALKGECVRWRSKHICSTMCANGKVYQECAEPCKKTCSNFALKPEPFCNQADRVEGCFCAKDYVENENGVCVPLSECPCSYSMGPGTEVEMFPAGTTIDIDCEKCTCLNSTFVCKDNVCPCLPDQFACGIGDKCLTKGELCDGTYDCPDQSDEYPLNPDCDLLTTLLPLTEAPATTISHVITAVTETPIPKSTPIDPCRKWFTIDIKSYLKSFEMTAKIDDGMTYLNATQALGGSDGSGFTIISEEDEVFTMSFHVTKNCTDKLFIDTIHFSTSGSKKVILIIELQVMAKWEFNDYLTLSTIKTDYKKAIQGTEFQLIFNSAKGRLNISDVSVNVTCYCAVPNNDRNVTDTTTLKTPMHSTPDQCPESLDLCIVLDASGSMCDHMPGFNFSTDETCQNWNDTINFILAITNDFAIGMRATRVGMVIVSTHSYIAWNLTTYTDLPSLRRAISGLAYKKGGQTNMVDGLRMMRTQVFHTSVDRPDVPNTALIITDGRQFPPKPLLLQEEIREVKESGISTLVVGITTKDLDVESVIRLSSPPQKENETFFLNPDFESLERVFRKKISFQTCNLRVSP